MQKVKRSPTASPPKKRDKSQPAQTVNYVPKWKKEKEKNSKYLIDYLAGEDGKAHLLLLLNSFASHVCVCFPCCSPWFLLCTIASLPLAFGRLHSMLISTPSGSEVRQIQSGKKNRLGMSRRRRRKIKSRLT